MGNILWYVELVYLQFLIFLSQRLRTKRLMILIVAAILQVATSKDYTAANNIHSYSTEGTSAGDWCLPAAGILKSISENYQAIQNSLNLVGGDELEGSLSSNMKDNKHYWYMNSFEKGVLAEGTDYIIDNDGNYIPGPDFSFGMCSSNYSNSRPVLEF